jgi:type VI secretion system protein ImpL
MELHQDKRMMAGMQAHYFKDYADAWQQFIPSIEMVPVQGLEHTANIVNVLVKEKGHFEKVLHMIADNTSGIQTEDTSFLKLKLNTKEFMSSYRQALKNMQQEINVLAAARHVPSQAHAYARQVLSSEQETGLELIYASLSSEITRTYGDGHPLLKPLLLSPLVRAWEAILAEAGTHIEQHWESDVLDVYNRTLKGKFPFARAGKDAQLSDVAGFFASEVGILPQYRAQYLQGFIQEQGAGLDVKTWLGRGLAITAPFLHTLSQAKDISESLFRAGADQPEWIFYIAPIPIPGVEELIFEHQGQVYRYRNEPEEWRKFSWPKEGSHMSTRIYLAKHTQHEWAELQHEGVWGLFHVLSEAQLSDLGGGHMMGAWSLRSQRGQGMHVKMKLRTDKGSNLLTPGAFMGFELPDKTIK